MDNRGYYVYDSVALARELAPVRICNYINYRKLTVCAGGSREAHTVPSGRFRSGGADVGLHSFHPGGRATKKRGLLHFLSPNISPTDGTPQLQPFLDS